MTTSTPSTSSAPPGYGLALVQRGSAVYVCHRCAACTIDPALHDEWHEVVGALLDVPGSSRRT